MPVSGHDLAIPATSSGVPTTCATTSDARSTLASLGLDLAGRTVLEVGAGIGDHTSFFLDRQCTVTSTDARFRNVELLQKRYPEIAARVVDLDEPPLFIDLAEIVYCYGLLYHLSYPERAIEFMGRASTGLLLIQTCVSRGSEEALNPVEEDARDPSQSISGRGCRPTRAWVLARLRDHFPYAYVTATQPWHPEFPLDWTRDSGESFTRAVFVASRTAIESGTLVDQPLDHQVRH